MMSKRNLLSYFSSSSSTPSSQTPNNENTTRPPPPKLARVEFSCLDIVGDPGMRKPIDEYPIEIRDQVRKAYALRRPTQQSLGYSFRHDFVMCFAKKGSRYC